MKTEVEYTEHNPKEDLKDIKIVGYPAFVTRLQTEKKTERGNIIIPESADDSEDYKVKVEKVSERCEKVEEGDTVLLRDRTQPIATFESNGNKYIIFEEISIVAIINKD